MIQKGVHKNYPKKVKIKTIPNFSRQPQVHLGALGAQCAPVPNSSSASVKQTIIEVHFIEGNKILRFSQCRMYDCISLPM